MVFNQSLWDPKVQIHWSVTSEAPRWLNLFICPKWTNLSFLVGATVVCSSIRLFILRVIWLHNNQCEETIIEISLTCRGAAMALLLSSTEVRELGVWSAARAGVELEMEADPKGAMLLSPFKWPLVSTTVGVSLSFFLLSVLTMGWS